ncbi:MAG: PH domain-containing protein [Nakamurella sp.]
MSTVYRPGASRVLAGAIITIGVLGVLALTWDAGIPGLLRYGWWIAGPAIAAWALFWNPRIEVDDSGVLLVNVFRSIRLPWPSIQAVDTKWALTLTTAYGTFSAWAAPAPGRHGSRVVSPSELKHLPRSSFSAEGTLRAGDAVNTPSGQAALAIRQHWEALRDAGHLDNPQLEFDHPPVHWHARTIAVLAGVLVLGVAGLVI